MITSTSVSVGTTPVLITTAVVAKSVALSNASSHTVYVGDSTVTTTSGMEMLANETYSFDLRAGESLYAVAGSTGNVLFLDWRALGVAPAPARLDFSVIPAATGATVATTVAGLGAGSDGKLGVIRVGTYPDTEYVELVYDNVNSVWVSKGQPLVFNSDLSYMGTNTTAYTYLTTDTTGAVSSGIGVAVKPVRHAAQLYTAGLTLQVCMTAIMRGSSNPSTFTVQAKFFQNNDGDAVVFSSDGSTAVGEALTALISNAGTGIVFKSTGWKNVVQNGGSTALTSADVTSANLWPRLYGKVGAGTAYGSVIDVDVQARWVG